MEENRKLGLAFQGGSFLAGAITTGVVRALVERGEFEDAKAFSGTSAGALVAAMCWGHKLRGITEQLPQHLSDQWLANANGLIPNEETGVVLKLVDRWLLLNPFYFQWKEAFFVPWLHDQFKRWVVEFIQPHICMRVLFDEYLYRGDTVEDYRQHPNRLWLAIGTTEIHTGKVVTIDDADLFQALSEAYATACGRGHDRETAREAAVRAAAEYMTLALMSSGSLDTLNGLTRIDKIDGIDDMDLLHEGEYLDGAYSQNPPISPLTKAGVDEIWMVEIFPLRHEFELDSNEKREDRKEELLQNAPVQHQYDFINKLNFWIATRRLQKPEAVSSAELEELWETDAEWRKEVIEAFKRTEPHPERWGETPATLKEIIEKAKRPYRYIHTHTIPLSVDLQPLTDAARIVNSPFFLLRMMRRGYDNTRAFLREHGRAARAAAAGQDSRERRRANVLGSRRPPVTRSAAPAAGGSRLATLT